jgi:hypothetical protein
LEVLRPSPGASAPATERFLRVSPTAKRVEKGTVLPRV